MRIKGNSEGKSDRKFEAAENLESPILVPVTITVYYSKCTSCLTIQSYIILLFKFLIDFCVSIDFSILVITLREKKTHGKTSYVVVYQRVFFCIAYVDLDV